MKALNKITVVFLCVSLIFGAALLLTARVSLKELRAIAVLENHTQIKGDVNGDGVADEKDLTELKTLIFHHLFKGEVVDSSADVNKDGKYDMRDIISMKKILKIIPTSSSNWTPPTPED